MAALPDGTTTSLQQDEGWNISPPEDFALQQDEGWNISPPEDFALQQDEGWEFLSSDLGTVTVTQTDSTYSSGQVGARFTDAGGQLDTIELCGDAQ